MKEIIIIIFTIFAFMLLFITIAYYEFYQYKKWIARKMPIQNDFGTLMQILTATIKTELDLYEDDIFSNKGGITNSNFDNYYNDLCLRIINSLSKQFIDQLTQYITYETIVRYIARSVKKYLSEKVNGTF